LRDLSKNIITDGKKKELSPREVEVFKLLIMGYTNKNIAEQLFISPYTAKRHTENIYRKMQVSSRIGLLVKSKKKST
jgi:DNA-binding NarL/FixJ family response regulator